MVEETLQEPQALENADQPLEGEEPREQDSPEGEKPEGTSNQEGEPEPQPEPQPEPVSADNQDGEPIPDHHQAGQQ